MAGYSGTPLAQKLGIKPGHRVALVDAPDDFTALLGDLPLGVSLRRGLDEAEPFDVILAFVDSHARLAARFSMLAGKLAPAGGLWIAWPKKASGVATDLTEDRVREVGLDGGLVDNKVCAVDETWSGLRFVFRLKDRPKKAARPR
jgi:hypothetical protein